MAIMGIIVVAFLAIFTSGFLWIYTAGDRGFAYSEAQQDIESRMAMQDAVLFEDDLILDFNGTVISISGGLIGTTQTVGRVSSSPEVFLPWVPFIEIAPNSIVEGTNLTGGLEIRVTGTNTNFISGNTRFEVLDVSGSNSIGPFSGRNFSKIVNNADPTNIFEQDLAFFDMVVPATSALVNAQGKHYHVRASTNIPSRPTEFARANFFVQQPYLVAVGSAGSNPAMFVSADGLYWQERTSLTGFPSGVNNLNAVAYGRNTYVAVGDSGTVITSTEKKPWSVNTVGWARINDVLFYSTETDSGGFVAVSSDGTIHISSDGKTWSSVTPSIISLIEPELLSNEQHSNQVVLTGLDVFVESGSATFAAVGYIPVTIGNVKSKHGIVLTSSDSFVWNLQSVAGSSIMRDTAFYDVAFKGTANELVVVGAIINATETEAIDNGRFAMSLINWSIAGTPSISGPVALHGRLTGVIWDGTHIYSVGYDGNNGVVHQNAGVMHTVTGNAVNGIINHTIPGGFNRKYAVGDQQTLIVYDGSGWINASWSTNFGSPHFYSVAGR
jgi:hypothetical protein